MGRTTLKPCEVAILQDRCASVLPAGELSFVNMSNSCQRTERQSYLTALAKDYETTKATNGVAVTFVNLMNQTVYLYWIEGYISREDAVGKRLLTSAIEPGLSSNLNTFHTHRFVAASEQD